VQSIWPVVVEVKIKEQVVVVIFGKTSAKTKFGKRETIRKIKNFVLIFWLAKSIRKKGDKKMTKNPAGDLYSSQLVDKSRQPKAHKVSNYVLVGFRFATGL